jgi:hypothetical protein
MFPSCTLALYSLHFFAPFRRERNHKKWKDEEMNAKPINWPEESNRLEKFTLSTFYTVHFRIVDVRSMIIFKDRNMEKGLHV